MDATYYESERIGYVPFNTLLNNADYKANDFIFRDIQVKYDYNSSV